MIENTNSMNEASTVIETAIGPLDMAEVVDGYGQEEEEVTKDASEDVDDTAADGEKEKLQEENPEKSDEAGEGEKATPGLEKFPLPLNVYGQNVELTLEEATRAIQRGLAFDKVKDDLFMAKNDDRLLILAQIAKDTGKTSSQLLSKLQGDCILESLEKEYGEIGNVPQEKIAEAVGKMSSLERMTQELPFKEKQLAARQQLTEFHRQNPGVSEIPDEVLEAVGKDISLEKAYDLYRISELEAKLEKLTRESKIAKQRDEAQQIEAPSLLGQGSSYSMGEEDVYAFFKKMW